MLRINAHAAKISMTPRACTLGDDAYLGYVSVTNTDADTEGGGERLCNYRRRWQYAKGQNINCGR
jgi:hypothetical protein